MSHQSIIKHIVNFFLNSIIVRVSFANVLLTNSLVLGAVGTNNLGNSNASTLFPLLFLLS